MQPVTTFAQAGETILAIHAGHGKSGRRAISRVVRPGRLALVEANPVPGSRLRLSNQR